MFTKTLFAAAALAAVMAVPAHADGAGQGGPVFNGISLNGLSIQGIGFRAFRSTA